MPSTKRTWISQSHDNATNIMPKSHGDSGTLEFQELAKALEPFIVESVCKFPLLNLPLELREEVYKHYIIMEKDDDMRRHLHYDSFRNECCWFNWPHELIICDCDRESLPHPNLPEFLPFLCYTNQQVRSEVAQLLLRHTKEFTFKYYPHYDGKIVEYFMKFLHTVSRPGYSGFDSIHQVTFPHIYKYLPLKKANPDVELMVRCTKLRQVNMTFSAESITATRSKVGYLRMPRPLDEFIDFYGLRPILECKELQVVYLDGIMPNSRYAEPYDGFDCMKTLRDFAAWLGQGLKDQGGEVAVYLHQRYRYTGGRHGELIWPPTQ